jgi:hypothetical protein
MVLKTLAYLFARTDLIELLSLIKMPFAEKKTIAIAPSGTLVKF